MGGFWERFGRVLGALGTSRRYFSRFLLFFRRFVVFWLFLVYFFRFGLLFAFAAFRCLLSFAGTSFTFSGLGLHASTTLICIRSSRSLLRQVFLLGSWRVFFAFPVPCYDRFF